MLYYMTNKNAQIVLNGVSDTGNISMQDKKKKKKKKTWQYTCTCVSYT